MHRAPSTDRPGASVTWDRHGLTLVEVLVCLMLLSLLAAAVFPVVTQKVARAEPRQAQEDLTAIQEAIERFARDLEGHYPADLDDLSSPLDSTDRAVIRPGRHIRYTPEIAARWAGPYLPSSISERAGRVSGFGVPIIDELVLFDAAAGAPDGAPGFRSDSEAIFLAVRIGTTGRRLTPSQFDAVDAIIDGPSAGTLANARASRRSGRLRLVETGASGSSIAYFLAVPLGE